MRQTNPMTGLTNEQVLAEIEDVIRAMPDRDEMHLESPEILAWFGRAAAAINNWSMPMIVNWSLAVRQLRSRMYQGDPVSDMISLLYQAQHDLRMKTIGPVNVAIGQGHVFDYLDKISKIAAQAKTDAMFVDRYMNGEFIGRFLPFFGDSVRIRLLTRNQPQTAKSLAQLITMARAYSAQHNAQIEIRSHNDHHQRYLFVDGVSCYESGASFKDGPLTAGMTITERTGDTLADLLNEHETLWQNAVVECST